MGIKIIFMGSPDFALPALKQLAERYQLIGVITQPDRRAGRGRALTTPPVKSLALSLGIEVFQPKNLKEPEAIACIQAWHPDLIVVVAFGQILRKNVLDLPEFGCINIHGSLLPRWRGAAPIQAALLDGDKKTGVTIMKMDAGIDTGPIISQQEVEVLPKDTAETLSARLAVIGAELLLETLPGYIKGRIIPQPQEASYATYAGRIEKKNGELDFTHTAEALERCVRAFYPWPGAFTYWQGKKLKIHQAHVLITPDASPGMKMVLDGYPAIGTRKGCLVLDKVQLEGRKPIMGTAFLHGARMWGASD